VQAASKSTRDLARESNLRFRLAESTDLEATYRVYLAANQDLNRKIGRHIDLHQQTLPTRAIAVRRNALRYDQERFWVIESGSSLAGFGLAIRRPSFWYLAALHVMPEFQSQGLGSKLLRKCLGDLDRSENQIPLLTTSDSANLASTGLYMRRGLLPQEAIVQFRGRPKQLGIEGITLRPVDWQTGQVDCNRLDQIVFGAIRPEDHLGWASVPSMTLYFVCRQGRVVGYIYVDRDGALGPAAVEQPYLLAPTIAAAFSTYGPGHTTDVQLRVPGSARPCLDALFSAGFSNITEIRLLLTSRPFGCFDRYLPSGADALF
jgi:GNAT superfamily N-acetyltransferase